jgi:tRNA A-37 threonylcarbamoyl transferase component Bud32
MRKFDPRLCQPHLEAFVDDEYPPSAIFLEYVAGMEMMTINNCTEPRFNSMIMGIKEIHKALVRHRDPKPRNIMVLKDQPERVVWIDFDRAETYDEDTITERQKRFIDEEEQTVGELAECLVSATRNSDLLVPLH